MGKQVSIDRRAELVVTKLREADYFLRRMAEANFDIWAFSCDLSAFLTSARSVTFAMQSVMKDHPRWDRWYTEIAGTFWGPRATLMKNLRNISEKNADSGLRGGAMRGGVAHHYFDQYLLTDLAEDERDCDVLQLCERHMGVLVMLVATWLDAFKTMWGLPDEVDPNDDTPFGWSRGVARDGTATPLMGSPGELPPRIDDLRAAWEYFPDRA
jgi:hypothetical protein